jgi:RND family efflux transporter MFP subunit
MNAMGEPVMRARLLQWSLALLALAGIGLAAAFLQFNGNRSAASATSPAAGPVAENASAAQQPGGAAVRVETVQPARGGLARETRQPGTAHAFEWADLYTKVPGFLKTQKVDIGDRVQRDQLLAEIYAPEVEIAVNQAAAALSQAQAEVELMKTQVVTAQAKYQAALATVARTEAELGRAVAQRRYQQKQFDRIKKLAELKSIDEKLVDERQQDLDAAVAEEEVVNATIVTAKADATTAAAKVEEAKADVVNSQATVVVNQAALDRAKILAAYLQITSPYDGVITKRKFHVGDFIREAERADDQPLLEVQRTDLIRVVVQVPDLDVPTCLPGNEAVYKVDALPGEVFRGAVARVGEAEDEQKTMRVEIDLPNPQGRIKAGMYGLAIIKLRSPATAAFNVPTTCLVGSVESGKGSMYVVRDGKAWLVRVEVGYDDGIHVEIIKGLGSGDRVIYRYSGALADGVPVEVNQ